MSTIVNSPEPEKYIHYFHLASNGLWADPVVKSSVQMANVTADTAFWSLCHIKAHMALCASSELCKSTRTPSACGKAYASGIHAHGDCKIAGIIPQHQLSILHCLWQVQRLSYILTLGGLNTSHAQSLNSRAHCTFKTEAVTHLRSHLWVGHATSLATLYSTALIVLR